MAHRRWMVDLSCSTGQNASDRILERWLRNSVQVLCIQLNSIHKKLHRCFRSKRNSIVKFVGSLTFKPMRRCCSLMSMCTPPIRWPPDVMRMKNLWQNEWDDRCIQSDRSIKVLNSSHSHYNKNQKRHRQGCRWRCVTFKFVFFLFCFRER